MIFAYVTMREYVGTKLLRRPQAGTMAKHDPCMWTQHCNVVRDALGITGPDADIHHRDTGAIVAHQVVGRHLGQTRRHYVEPVPRLGRRARAKCDHVARLHKGRVLMVRWILVGHQSVPEANELVDVELVVGE